MWHEMQKIHHLIELDSIHVEIVANIRPVINLQVKKKINLLHFFINAIDSEITKKKLLPEFRVWHTIQCWKWHTLRIRQYSTINNQNSGQQHFCAGNLCKSGDKMILTMQQNNTIQSPMKRWSIRLNRRQ